MVGLKQLLRTEPLATVRLWGTVTGTQRDYCVAEGKADPARLAEHDEEEEEPEEEDEGDGVPIEAIADVLFGYAAQRRHATAREPASTGLNEHVYYAASTTDPTHWTRLPDVTPQQITAARAIRRGFTGDLEAAVHGSPRFPGVERHYLRAQIARITSACRLAPKDIFTTDGAVPEPAEDEEGNVLPPPPTVPAYTAVPPLLPQEVPDEDDAEAVQPIAAWFRGYPDDELLQPRFWVHTAPTLLRCGRTTAEVPAAVTGEPDDGEPPDEPVEQPELITPFLSDLTKDAALVFPGHSRPSFPAWTFRKGYHNESSLTRTYLARSLLWPGAVNYAVTVTGQPGARYQMLYIGNGLKDLQGADYAPALPPPPMVEYPEEGLVLQRDCTAEEEAAYAPVPRPPASDDEEGDENDEDEEDGE